MSFQDPSIVWNIARRSGNFVLRRNGITRSQDKLNVTGRLRRDDGIFAPANVKPISFERGTVKVKDQTRQVIVSYSRNKAGRTRRTLIGSSNGKAVAKAIRNRKNGGRLAPFAAVRAGRVARSIGRSFRKVRVEKKEKKQ
eukprot:PhF_6_TR38046/c0_g1_i1/m.56771